MMPYIESNRIPIIGGTTWPILIRKMSFSEAFFQTFSMEMKMWRCFMGICLVGVSTSHGLMHLIWTNYLLLSWYGRLLSFVVARFVY